MPNKHLSAFKIVTLLLDFTSLFLPILLNVFSLLVFIGSWNFFAGGFLSSLSPLKVAKACSPAYKTKRSEAIYLVTVFAVEMLMRSCFSTNGLTKSLMRQTTVDTASSALWILGRCSSGWQTFDLLPCAMSLNCPRNALRTRMLCSTV